MDPVEGRILVDGIDISTIGIHDLRSRVVCLLAVFCLNSSNDGVDLHSTSQYGSQIPSIFTDVLLGRYSFLWYSAREPGSLWCVSSSAHLG